MWQTGRCRTGSFRLRRASPRRCRGNIFDRYQQRGMVMPGMGTERGRSLDRNPLADQTLQRARQRGIRARVIRQELNAVEALARVEKIISDRASGGVQRENVGGLARVAFANVLEIRRTRKDLVAQ